MKLEQIEGLFKKQVEQKQQEAVQIRNFIFRLWAKKEDPVRQGDFKTKQHLLCCLQGQFATIVLKQLHQICFLKGGFVITKQECLTLLQQKADSVNLFVEAKLLQKLNSLPADLSAQADLILTHQLMSMIKPIMRILNSVAATNFQIMYQEQQKWEPVDQTILLHLSTLIPKSQCCFTFVPQVTA